jgi:CRISPR-associated protein Csm2
MVSRHQSSRRRGASTTFPLPSDEELEKIIQFGDAELAVNYAQALGERLATQLTSSQIRNVFTTTRQIEMNWPVHAEQEEFKEAVRQLILLKPKLAYQASRDRRGGIGMKVLYELLVPAIDLVGKNREYFQNFIDFFEAIVAYHTAASER